MTVTEWFRAGLFKSEEQARGAFELAHQQWLESAKGSHHEWMGMTQAESESFRRDGTLPKR